MATRRGRAKGSVWRQKDGRWVSQVGYYGEDGKRKYLTRITGAAKDDRVARHALAGLLIRVGSDRKLIDVAQTLDAFLAEWLERLDGSVGPATLVSYRGHVKSHIGPLLGGIPVEDLRAADVDRLVRDRAKAGKSAATIGRILTTLSMALEQSVREGLLPRNVARLARRPKVQRPEIAALTPERAGQILDAVAGDPLEALYVLLLGSGMRLGEAIALDWRNVDLEGRAVWVKSGKTPRSRRWVSIPPFVVTSLKAHRARARRVGLDEPVFVGERTGERLRVDVGTHRLPKLLAAAGLPRMRVHDLRHGHATLLLAGGTPMRLIADQLGHANPAMTEKTYAHVIEAQLRAAVDDLGRIVRRTG